MHDHKCESCGKVWTHSDTCVNNVAAHLCPNCGAGPQWYKYFPEWDDVAA